MAYVSELQKESVDYEVCEAFGAVYGIVWKEGGEGGECEDWGESARQSGWDAEFGGGGGSGREGK